MKPLFILTALAVSMPSLLVRADNCTTSPEGNTYCQPVKSMLFANFGQPGSYNRVTAMDNTTGVCTSENQTYSGGMSPLDEEVSWHFRGPMHLKQFAFYTLEAVVKRHVRSHHHHFLHEHKHQLQAKKHARAQMEKKRAVGDMVVATIDGQVVSWINEYSGITASPTAEPSQTSQADSDPSMITATINGQVVSWANPDSDGESSTANSAQDSVTSSTSSSADSVWASTTASTAASSSEASSQTSSSYSLPSTISGSWLRQSYYSAENGSAQNVVFLNNMGGTNSGIVDDTFGASLSYASADALTGATGPTILSDIQLGDGTEVAIFSGSPCNSSDDCGFYRPGTVAYHGFGGASKLFLLEFDMPYTGATGFNKDMPAIWILNALIPRTLQYGEADCSCWESGCGEWDIFEVLESGRDEMMATYHGDESIGESDYFTRPSSGETIKAMVFMDGVKRGGSIVVIDGDTDFDLSLDADSVEDMLNTDGAATLAVIPE